MTVKESKSRKLNTYEKAKECFESFDKFVIVSMDNITANQLKDMKRSWGSSVTFLIGKNSSVRRALKDLGRKDLNEVLDQIKGNVSVVFFSGDVQNVKSVIDQYERESVAKVGDIAQTDVWINSHITAMTTEKTGYFQTLGISTKVTKGKIEIIQDFKVLSTGDKVGPSQANLLALVNIKPFRYKMGMISVYENGELYDSSLLNVEQSDIDESLRSTILDIARFSLGSNTLTEASVPYEINRSFHDVLKFAYGLGVSIIDSPYPMVN